MVFSPNQITKEHILAAVSKINNQNISLIPSTRWDVVIEGKKYPPKEILRFAHEQSGGERIWFYSGGVQTNRFLNKFGFEVVEKDTSKNPILRVIGRYKEILKKNGLKDEVYKWQLIQKFKSRPNLANEDLFNELKEINYTNLMFHTAKGVSLHLAKEKPNEYREQFKNLFDENIPLNERIPNFINGTLQIYRQLENDFGTHHDERTISTFLTFYNPSKYNFFKDSFYKKYCSFLGVDPQKKGRKYSHYLELVDDLINEYLVEDKELLDLINHILPPDAFNDENHLILAQDFLYQTFDKSEVNYWIFQCNPNDFDFESALANDAIDNWTVNTHRDKIKSGDRVILWLTGKNSGCYALAEVTSKPELIDSAKDDTYWKKETNSRFAAGIQVTHNLVANPILREAIKNTVGFENFKGGNQGTNFSATKKEYELFLNMTESDREPQFWLWSLEK